MTKVSRALLKKAMDEQNWDLLDRLLTLDNSAINDKSVYTDTWGEWWGFLYEAILNEQLVAVNILLKHGAKKSVGNWGDCIELSPIELAEEKGLAEIVELLKNPAKAQYEAQKEVEIPSLDAQDARVNQQGAIRDQTGLIFPIAPDTE